MKEKGKSNQKISNWEEISELIASFRKRKILNSLKEPKTPAQLRKEFETTYAYISNTLRDLEKYNFIELLTPNKRKGKLFTITKKGRVLLEKADEIIKKK